MEYTITSKENALIKHVRALHQKKSRDEQEQFFVEGIKMTAEAIDQKAEILNIILSDEMLSKVAGGPELTDKIRKAGLSTELVSENMLRYISDMETPQGVLTLIKKKSNSDFEMKSNENRIYILLDGVQDPGNVGTIIRTADAAGISEIILSKGCADIYNPKTLRSTMGSVFRMPIVERADLCQTAKKMKEHGVKILATSLKSEHFHYDIDYTGDFALVIGSEANGVSTEMLELSDLTVKIPMRGGAESLNASVAAGILMYELIRNKH